MKLTYVHSYLRMFIQLVDYAKDVYFFCFFPVGRRHQTQQGPQGAQEGAKEPGYLPEAPG